jgi:hypothetical protein
LFYVEGNISLTKAAYVSKIHYHTSSLQDPAMNCSSVALIFQIFACTVLLLGGLLIVTNLKKKREVDVPYNGMTFVPNFVKINQLVQKLKGRLLHREHADLISLLSLRNAG